MVSGRDFSALSGYGNVVAKEAITILDLNVNSAIWFGVVMDRLQVICSEYKDFPYSLQCRFCCHNHALASTFYSPVPKSIVMNKFIKVFHIILGTISMRTINLFFHINL